MLFCKQVILSLWVVFGEVNGLYQDEVNVTDFHIKSCGHGNVRSVLYPSVSVGEIVISSGDDNCYVCGRRISNGEVVWRRDICDNKIKSIKTKGAQISLYESSQGIFAYSLSDGVARRWNQDGDLVDERFFKDSMELFTFPSRSSRYVAIVTKSQELRIVNEQFEEVNTLKLNKVLEKILGSSARKFTSAKLFQVQHGHFLLSFLPEIAPENYFLSVSNLLIFTIGINGETDEIITFKKTQHNNANVNIRTLGISNTGVVSSLTESGLWVFSNKFGSALYSAGSINSKWTGFHDLEVLVGNFIRVSAMIEENIVHRLVKIIWGGAPTVVDLLNNSKQKIDPVSLASFTTSSSKTFLAAVVIEGEFYSVFLYELEDGEPKLLYNLAPNREPNTSLPSIHSGVEDVFLSCTESSECHVLISTTHGTTIEFSTSNKLNYSWVQEEALGFISHSVFLDHVDEGNYNLYLNKPFYFGFQKLLILLSSTYHSLFVMETVGDSKGQIIYSRRLPSNANKHVLVQGNISSKSGVHGAYFPSNTQHAQELLVLSFFDDKINWHCLVSGKFMSGGEVTLEENLNVLSIFPFYDPNNQICPQNALLLLDNEQIIILPEKTSYQNFKTQFIPKKGLFLHSVNKETGFLNSFMLQDDFKLKLTCRNSFNHPQERIKSVHYPSRNQVVQSPSNILGDDSLLIKYLNPHIMVVVSEITPQYLKELEEKTNDAFFESVLQATTSSSSPLRKKKPLGVSLPNNQSSSVTTQQEKSLDIPTLFITLLDSSSCRILHRVSHSHITSNDTSYATDSVPLVISENWILYSYFNYKAKRTELSVLSSYEGMMSKNGITAFTRPEQELEFDSFLFPKPIVLQKTFTVPKKVTSIGITRTSRGISSKKVILGLGDIGWVWAFDQRLTDPRRPTSDPKTAEKSEGLFKYTPLIQIMPFQVLSHNLNIERTTHILTSSVRLESQSLVLAFGGPDLFFTRIAPSKGFDLLPDDFNKPLLGVVVVGLLIVLFCVKKQSEKKILKASWQ